MPAQRPGGGQAGVRRRARILVDFAKLGGALTFRIPPVTALYVLSHPVITVIIPNLLLNTTLVTDDLGSPPPIFKEVVLINENVEVLVVVGFQQLPHGLLVLHITLLYEKEAERNLAEVDGL